MGKCLGRHTVLSMTPNTTDASCGKLRGTHGGRLAVSPHLYLGGFINDIKVTILLFVVIVTTKWKLKIFIKVF